MQKLCKFLATGFEVGMIPGAPGTYGTVVAVAIYLFLYTLPLVSYILFTIAFIFLAVWVTAQALPSFKKSDPSEIVIDEMAGFFVAMIGLPFSLLNLGMGFVLFRFFDIVKPPPICYIDKKIKGAWGIVLDDVAAGIFACVVMWVVNIVRG